MPVRHDEMNRLDHVHAFEARLLPCRTACAGRIGCRVPRTFRAAYWRTARQRVPKSDVDAGVAPCRGQRRGENPIARFRQRRELVARIAGKRGVPGFHDQKVRARRRQSRCDRACRALVAVRVSGPDSRECLTVLAPTDGDTAPDMVEQVDAHAAREGGLRSRKCRASARPNVSGSFTPSRAASAYTVFFIVSVGSTPVLSPSV